LVGNDLAFELGCAVEMFDYIVGSRKLGVDIELDAGKDQAGLKFADVVETTQCSL
jgi:hypothetical protein